MSSISLLLPGDLRLTLFSISLLCATLYLINSHRHHHVPYQFLLNLVILISGLAYIPVILVKAYEYAKPSRVSLSPSTLTYTQKRVYRRESIWRRWINSAELLLVLTFFQFAATCGFLALSLLSIYTLYSFLTLTSPNIPAVSTSPSKTFQPLYILIQLGIDDFMPLLLQLVHMTILAIELLAFMLLVTEIRGSPRYSLVDRSFAGLLEKDINDLIQIRDEIRYLKTPTSRWSERNSIGHSTYTDWSPIRESIEEKGAGTPRKRSRSSSANTALITPSAPPREIVNGDIAAKDIRFSDSSNTRRSSRGNRRMSVRFDLSRHLDEAISPRTTSFVNPMYAQDYFSLPLLHSEVTRPIPLSIVRSPKEAGVSPSSDHSEMLENILEEEDHEGVEGRDKSWMDIRGEESV
ncbi:uncharacterized protein I303_106648 [Kwoniella dejecticola CBS 10117]|uniref:Uncharacterized protein n=1 Tax=Kwoniella dejecticola CBS 10117 TaxID=1296121 RepID=A0A1A5ZU32_9TREE|nr:uncharacterized protein I303_08709 [Kwoniella dejecticola CBS 10117]OBR81322.1 hypothetical protein I303_08709 [Kwoniella dejecticola CBS 10117]